MLGIVMVIVGIGLLLIAWAFISDALPQKRSSQEQVQTHMEKVREAAFAVIEASLEAEPEKWKVITFEGQPLWIVNPSAQIAMFIPSHHSLYVLRNYALDIIGLPRTTEDTMRLDPPSHMRVRLYEAAMKQTKPILEKQETDKLARMVAAFGDIVDRRKNHDQKAA